MAAERCKCATFLPSCSEQTIGSNVFNILGNMHRDFVYCMKLILKEFMRKKLCKIEKKKKNGQIKPNSSGVGISKGRNCFYDVVNASYLPTTINIYDLEIRSINNYRKSYNIANFLVSTTISRRCRFGNSKPCKYIRSSYVRRNCIYDNNRVSANISSYDYR